MTRTLIAETTKHVGEKIKVEGWVNVRRDHGGIVFLDLRDRSGILQVVAKPDLVQDVKEEYVLEIEGLLQQRPMKMVNPELATGQVEMKAESIKVLAKSEPLIFDIKNMDDVSLPVILDNRPLTLRNEKIKTIFNIEKEVVSAFRKTLEDLGFFEFDSPIIVPATAEGGAEVFKVDYYGRNAYLTQSPQLYKQILVSIFERVFTVTHVFRAEPSVTTRHLAEYVSLDAEMGFIDSWEDIMDTCETVVKNIFSAVENKCSKELALRKATLPKTGPKIPRIKMREAQEIIFQRTGRDNRKEVDLEPDDEKEICQWAKEKHGSDLVFVTHFPTKKRPFYTYADPADPEYTLSFDLLCRGLEIVTGGRRINDYKALLANIEKWKMDVNNLKFYLQSFEFGMPPEGGFAIGSERLVKQILGLENVREASLFPRDMERIDQRLSVLQPKKERAKTKNAKSRTKKGKVKSKKK